MTTPTNTIILGGGQAGLALSHCLTARGRDHLVIERGRVGERWYSERWDSLRLLTPNWMTRLPGWSYRGLDPDGYMSAPEVAEFFRRYARSFDAPVREHTTIRNVARGDDSFVVTTDDGVFRAHNVVVATGWCDQPAVPAIAQHLSPHIHQLNPSDYRRPDDVADGGVLVVGASATGVQLAHELRASGREVTIAVGSHSRLPRRHRGMDIFWWLDVIGSLNTTVDDVVVDRNEPSLQLVGRADQTSLDLTTLADDGVSVTGRLAGIDGTRITVGSNLHYDLRAADHRMAKLLGRIDDYVDRSGLSAEVLPSEMPRSIRPDIGPDVVDLRAAGISTVIWATGHRRRYDWLQLPVFDDRGEISQYRGITRVPGAYVLGQRFQHHRNSNFIDGVGRDAMFVADHICSANHSSPTLQNRA
jgi:putative flavoprotein involved in K+ transport